MPPLRAIVAKPGPAPERLHWAWSVAMGLGRLADMDPDVISMGRLLEEIENHSEVLTREWFIPQLRTNAPNPRVANTSEAVFNQYAPEGAPHILAEKVRGDREYLQDNVDTVRTMVNRRFHYLATELAPGDVTLDEVGHALTGIGARYRCYELLLNQRWAVNTAPPLPKDWDRPFVTPLTRPS